MKRLQGARSQLLLELVCAASHLLFGKETILEDLIPEVKFITFTIVARRLVKSFQNLNR